MPSEIVNPDRHQDRSLLESFPQIYLKGMFNKFEGPPEAYNYYNDSSHYYKSVVFLIKFKSILCEQVSKNLHILLMLQGLKTFGNQGTKL